MTNRKLSVQGIFLIKQKIVQTKKKIRLLFINHYLFYRVNLVKQVILDLLENLVHL